MVSTHFRLRAYRIAAMWTAAICAASMPSISSRGSMPCITARAKLKLPGIASEPLVPLRTWVTKPSAKAGSVEPSEASKMSFAAFVLDRLHFALGELGNHELVAAVGADELGGGG